VTIQRKLSNHFPVVLFITLHRVVQAVASVNEIVKCTTQKKSYSAYYVYPVMLFATLNKMTLTFNLKQEIFCVTAQTKAVEHW